MKKIKQNKTKQNKQRNKTKQTSFLILFYECEFNLKNPLV